MSAKTDPLHVLTVVFNPLRYKTRYDLYRPFAKHVHDSGGVLWTVEVAFGDRPFEVTDGCNPHHLQLRSSNELWIKERALNLLAQRLPRDWSYLCWADSDLFFVRPDWVRETVQELQRFAVVQPFSRAVDLSPDYEPVHIHKGFVSAYWRGEIDMNKRPYEGAHPGYAQAWRRDAFDAVGGLFDSAVLGSGDRHMWCSLLTDVDRSYPPGISDGYVEQLKLWEGRAKKLKRNCGFIPGTICHAWHGPKANRQYLSRWQILIKGGYDPELDLQPDWQGLWQLTDRSPALRDDIRRYFAARREDDRTEVRAGF